MAGPNDDEHDTKFINASVAPFAREKGFPKSDDSLAVQLSPASITKSTPQSDTWGVDEFGLPVRPLRKLDTPTESSSDEQYDSATEEAMAGPDVAPVVILMQPTTERGGAEASNSHVKDVGQLEQKASTVMESRRMESKASGHGLGIVLKPTSLSKDPTRLTTHRSRTSKDKSSMADPITRLDERPQAEKMVLPPHMDAPLPLQGASEWSHQQVVPQSHESEEEKKKAEDDWQEMPAFAPYNLYDDDGRLIAKEAADSDGENAVHAGLGGAGKGYTRVNIDEDAQSATSMDENTKYLFKEPSTNIEAEDEEGRDSVAQLQATKDLLTEQQRIAYVGLVRVAVSQLVKAAEHMEGTRSTRKELRVAAESMKMWSQKMMVRLYAHMEISSAEQIMIEQLAEHGVQAADLTPTLMANARVKNPMADLEEKTSLKAFSGSPAVQSPSLASPRAEMEAESPPPPAYEEHEGDELPEVRTPSQLPTTKNIDIDLRWTVLCDLFLCLIADSIYDSRSRVLLERVGSFLGVSWLEICRFEKRVTDALEMQEAANKENWSEDEHLETRRKLAVKRRYMMMGLATVGGSLVIGLSAGLLAPVIGAGLAAGFTTIGVAGTSGFLAGAGGAAVITTIGVTTGGAIAVKSTARRMGSVKTFEYRPLHNNKRVNLILTVSGWMNGKVDDVRLPYSTVDPIMGDIYSLLWEPEMLQSMGQTINILATEALTQGLQQVLGSTILVALMASIQLPIVLTKLAYLIDNPWTVSLDRATSAGQILADSLVDRNLGVRPVTLVGFSLGARVIHSCLKELASKGAYGLVQNVYLFGSPVVAKKDEYLRARSVISGRFVNGYAKNDWILGYLFRATSGGIMRVAGLAPVEDVPGLENIDVTELVNGHMAYRAAMPRLLREVGWEVESDEFVEIEDPDPENHQERQREIIAEIDEARKEIEKKPEKKRFGFFNRKKAVEKKEWETYDEGKGETGAGKETPAGFESSRGDQNASASLLFDVDAIRAELASEMIEVKQLESTLPPMKLDLSEAPIKSPISTEKAAPILRPTLRSTSSCGPYAPRGEDDLTTFSNFRKSLGGSSSKKGTSELKPKADEVPQSYSGLTNVVTPKSELKSTSPLPSTAPPVRDADHNAWLDEDEEFGVEKEVTMSFE